MAELIFNTAIIVVAIIFCSGGDPIQQPYRVDVCLVESGSEGEDVTTNLWNDQIEVYFKRYPGSYCGRCGNPRTCPNN